VVNYIVNRLKEVSTWQGLVMGITLLGVHITPAQTQEIVTAGIAVLSAVSTFLPAHANGSK